MASVQPFRNPSGETVWRVQFRVDGKAKQETFTGPTAEKAGHEFGRLVDRVGGKTAREVLERRRSNTIGAPTLREWTTQYLDAGSGILTGIEPGTRAGYERIARSSFLQTLGDYPVDAIEKTDIGQWVEWQERQPSGRNKGQPIAAKTVRNYHALLSAVLAAAVENGIRTDNPAYRTRLSKGLKHEGVFLSADERATLMHFVPDRYQRFVLFLFGTGCRWGEATAITWGDLDLNATPPTVRISKAWKKGVNGAPVLKHPKSAKARRTISLWPDLVTALGEPRAGNELVFPGPISGGHMWYGRFASTVWSPAVVKANDPELCAAAGLTPLGKRPTIHDTRHTHASMLLSRGTPLQAVQARLGHEKITTTVDVYGHLAPTANAEMSLIMAQEMTNVLPTVLPLEVMPEG